MKSKKTAKKRDNTCVSGIGPYLPKLDAEAARNHRDRSAQLRSILEERYGPPPYPEEGGAK